MAKNKNLHKAKKEKNDEFYTQLSDIENELQYYKEHFKDKIVYCNCDDHKWSNFFQYFSLNFEFLGLKKLITTHFSSEGVAYKLEITKDENGDGKIDGRDVIETPLKQNGDFRSDEAVELLKECDIVVTNPPFSEFISFIDLIMKHKKKFLVIGNSNTMITKNIFQYIKDNQMWLGINPVKRFLQPDNSIKEFGNICWFTNLSHKKRNEELILYKNYTPEEYPKYDNYDIIEVSKVVNIPLNFNGIMGVPITFLSKWNPNQFEIIWQASGNTRANSPEQVLNDLKYSKHKEDRGGCAILNNKRVYSRLLIKHKNQNNGDSIKTN